MKKEELVNVRGGGSFNATFISALARGAEFVYNLGRSLGSTVKMIISGSKC